MKTFLLLVGFIIVSMNLIAQTQNCDILFDYSLAAGWTSSPMNNQIIQIAGGQCHFENVPGSPNDVRISYSIAPGVGNTWSAEFLFRVSAVATQYGAALIPFVLTAGNLAPCNPQGQPSVQTNQDAIGVSCGTPHYQAQPIKLSPFIKNGNQLFTQPTPCEITINLNTLYRVKLDVLTPTKGSLTVFIPTTNIPIGKCCFDIPPGVTGLYMIQSANLVQADQSRRITGTMDNLCLKRSAPICCPDSISGPIAICLPTTQSTTYSVTYEASTTYNWVVPSGITYTVSNPPNSITITNWGSVSGPIQIKLYRECNCETRLSVMYVYITPDLTPFASFNVNVQTSGLLVTPIIATPQATAPPGVIHSWSIYKALNNTPGDFQTTGPLLRPSVSGTTFTVTSPNAPNPDIVKDWSYIIIHAVGIPNNPQCWKQKSFKIMASGGKQN